MLCQISDTLTIVSPRPGEAICFACRAMCTHTHHDTLHVWLLLSLMSTGSSCRARGSHG